MLTHIDIQNLAIIDNLSIDLDSGFTVLTGETGAGKSIVIDAISAVLGGRISKEWIRSGKEKATVEAAFCAEGQEVCNVLETLGISPEEDGTLILFREFTTSGKNTCRINNKMVTVSALKEIGEKLVDIHGQYENQSLLKTENHIELLDAFGGSKIAQPKEQYAKLYIDYKAASQKLNELKVNTEEKQKRLDILRFQISEIKDASLQLGEEESLSEQKLLLCNTEKIKLALGNSYELLSGEDGITLSHIKSAVREMDSIAAFVNEFQGISQKLSDIAFSIEDVLTHIRHKNEQIEHEPKALEEVEDRLDTLYRLKKKYGATIQEVLNYCDNAECEVDEVSDRDEAINKLETHLDSLKKELYGFAVNINHERLEAADLLSKRVKEELTDLEMPNADLKAAINFDDRVGEKQERRFLVSGLDHVEFLFSANKGEGVKALAKIASGGEMSRVMLAVKSILAEADKIPTLIFDEIDTGISGKAAQKVGQKLKAISKRHQVLSVTHLAQIACIADHNYYIDKMTDLESTYTVAKRLLGHEITEEIARIIGGASISDATLKYAEEMIEKAKSPPCDMP